MAERDSTPIENHVWIRLKTESELPNAKGHKGQWIQVTEELADKLVTSRSAIRDAPTTEKVEQAYAEINEQRRVAGLQPVAA